MNTSDALQISRTSDEELRICFKGVWKIGTHLPAAKDVITRLGSEPKPRQIVFDAHQMKGWDSKLLTFLNSLETYCNQSSIPYTHDGLPDGVRAQVEVVPADMMDDDTKVFINETGRFVVGGPYADTGLTGRKIIVDTYGGVGSHGGGCFSGKDPSKVDRSGSYMARYVAKNIVAAGLAERCEVQIAYAIGVARPVSLLVDTYGSAAIDEERIEEIVRETFDLRPRAIIDHLDLLRPIYKKTAAYGHFGREDPDFTWERTDMVDHLRDQAGL